MKFFIDGLEIETSHDDLKHFNELWRAETKRLFSKKRYIHYVEIDGQVYYHNYESIILSQYGQIKEIRLQSISESELVNDSLAQLHTYTKKLIPACDSIGALFYGELTEQEWQLFSQFVEGIQWTYGCITGITGIMVNNPRISKPLEFLSDIEVRLGIQLSDLDKAFKDKEMVAAGDIIRYELSDIFNLLNQHLVSANGGQDDKVYSQ